MVSLLKTAEGNMGKSQDDSLLTLKRPAGDGERERLEAQHVTVIQSSGLLFHPALGDLSQFKSILDCAAGSTVWAEDLLAGGNEHAKQQPVKLSEGTVVDVCDIYTRHHPDRLPKKLNSFFERDIAEPFDSDKHQRYDLINGHFFVGWVRSSNGAKQEWIKVLSHLKDCLKPGGYINLREVSPRWDNPGPAPFLRHFEEITSKIWALTGHHPRLADELPDLMREAGFVDVQALILPWPLGAAGSSYGSDYVASSLKNADHLIGHDGIILSGVEHREGKEGVPTMGEAKRIAEGALKEVETVGAIWRSILVVGKKPE